jgi:MFS family permease
MLGDKLTDILGASVIFISALLITGIFALCAVIENQIIVLIIFKGFQGVSASLEIPSAFAIAGNVFQGIQLGTIIDIDRLYDFNPWCWLCVWWRFQFIEYWVQRYLLLGICHIRIAVHSFIFYPRPNTEERTT